MNFDNLTEQLDSNSKDTKINLKRLLLQQEDRPLDATSIQAITLAVSLSLEDKSIISASKDYAQQLDDSMQQAAAICANIMAMNNVFYRSTHLIESPTLSQLPAGLRMQGLMQHGIDKALFELMALAVSAINGCGMCLQSHYKQLQPHYNDEQIAFALKIAAVLAGLKQSLLTATTAT